MQTKNNKYYKAFFVGGFSPRDLHSRLNDELTKLQDFGWQIERIDCHINYEGHWDCDKREYMPNSEYIILAFCEREKNEILDVNS